MEMTSLDKKGQLDVPPSYNDCLLQQPSAPQQNVVNYAGDEHNARTVSLLQPGNDLLSADQKQLSCTKDGNSYTFSDASINQNGPLFNVTCNHTWFTGHSVFDVRSLTRESTDLLVKSTGSNMCSTRKFIVTKKNLSQDVVAVIRIMIAYASQRRHDLGHNVQEVFNSNGQELFKLEMKCEVPSGFGEGEIIYDVTARSQKIGKIKQMLNYCGESKYTFEYTLPLDVPTLSIFMCCILALDDGHNIKQRCNLHFFVGFIVTMVLIFAIALRLMGFY